MAIGQFASNAAMAGINKEIAEDQFYTGQAGQRKMARFNQALAFDLWEKTNFEAQKNKLKEAGMNPALMYGKGGQGGTLIQQGAAGDKPEATPMQAMDIASIVQAEAARKLADAQATKLAAEAKNIDADTANKPKTGANIDANTNLTNVNKEIADIKLEIDKNTQIDQESAIQAAAGKLRGEMNKADAEGNIAQSTQKVEIERAMATLGSVYIEQRLMKSQTELNDRQREAIADYIAQGYTNAWANQRTSIANDTNAQTRIIEQIVDKAYKEGIIDLGEKKLMIEVGQGLIDLLSKGAGGGATPIKGFR